MMAKLAFATKYDDDDDDDDDNNDDDNNNNNNERLCGLVVRVPCC
jgi:hypothetical protein